MKKTLRGQVIIINELKDDLANKQEYFLYNEERYSLLKCLLEKQYNYDKEFIHENGSNYTIRKTISALDIERALRSQIYNATKCAQMMTIKMRELKYTNIINPNCSIINDICILLQVYQKMLIDNTKYLDNIKIPYTDLYKYNHTNKQLIGIIENLYDEFISKLKDLQCENIEDFENILNPIARLGIKSKRNKFISEDVLLYLYNEHKEIYEQLSKDYDLYMIMEENNNGR